jgi:hypothetical protein
MEKISVVVRGSSDNVVIRKSFQGEWLVGDVPAENNPKIRYSVAKTEGERLAVYTHADGEHAGELEVFDSFEEFQGCNPENVVAEVASALGVDYEIELDI